MADLLLLVRLDGGPLEEPVLRAFARARAAPPPELRQQGGSASWALAGGADDSWSPPAGDAGAPERVLFVGRIDDASRLGSGSGAEAGDASRVGAAFRRAGASAFERLLGPFALVVVESGGRAVWLARDPVGARTLFYRREGSLLAVASRPSRLREIFSASCAPDEGSLARFLTAHGPRPGATFFQGVHELRPGEALRIGAQGALERRQLPIRTGCDPSPADESEWEARLRHAIDRAVGRRLPARGRCGVLMSGGLDSTSIAATAASVAGAAEEPLAISWTFEELHRSDESRWMRALVERHGLTWVPIVADQLFPLGAEPERSVQIDAPSTDFHWRVHRRALEVAVEGGCEVLLTGAGGDQLWYPGRAWLRDLLARGRLLEASRGLLRLAGYRTRGLPTRASLRASFARVVRLDPPPRRPEPPEWLTPEGRRLFSLEAERAEAERPPMPDLDRELLRALLSSHYLAGNAAEDRAAGQRGLEIRRPYSDRELIELLADAPPALLYRPGETKRLLRRALRDRLPEVVRTRRTGTSLTPLADRGLERLRSGPHRDLLEGPEALWPRFVRRDWLLSEGLASVGVPTENVTRVILWHCYCVERWRAAIA